MGNKIQFSRALLILGTCTFTLSPALGQQQLPSGPASGPRDPLAVYRQTGINQDQEKKIDTAMQQFRKLLVEKSHVMMGLMQDMRTLSLNPDPDEKAMNSKQDEINKLNNFMANERLKLMLSIRHIMTHEQRQKLVQQMQEKGGPMTAPMPHGQAPAPKQPASIPTKPPGKP